MAARDLSDSLPPPSQVITGHGYSILLSGLFFLISLTAYVQGCAKEGDVSPKLLLLSWGAAVAAAACDERGAWVFPLLLAYDLLIARMDALFPKRVQVVVTAAPSVTKVIVGYTSRGKPVEKIIDTAPVAKPTPTPKAPHADKK